MTVGPADSPALRRSERVQCTWSLCEVFGSLEFMDLLPRDGAWPDDVRRRRADTMNRRQPGPGVQQWLRSQPTTS